MGNITQRTIRDGLPQRQKVTSQQFSIPLQSGILGNLVPNSSYKLIPMNALKDLQIILHFNPYAYFSSGYKSARDSLGAYEYKNFKAGLPTHQ